MGDNNTRHYLEKVNDCLQVLISNYGQMGKTIGISLEPVMQEAVRQLHWMKRRLLAEEFCVGFVGSTNTGKSTLLNALFGEQVAPKWNGPCSSAPVEFRFGDRYRAIVNHCNMLQRIKTDCSSAAELCEVIKRHATESEGKPGGSTVVKLVAEMPNSLLVNRLVVADTPGFGAAQVEANAGRHQQSLLSYLPNVHQVFWVMRTSGEICISKQEANFYNQYLRGCCGDLVLTGSENLDQLGREQFTRYCCEHLGVYFLRIHFVSGKQAFKAKQTGNLTALELTGIQQLESRLTEVADTAARPARIAEEMMTLCSDLGTWLNQFPSHLTNQKRWASVRVEWLNAMHYAGLLEVTASSFAGWRNKLETALAGKS